MFYTAQNLVTISGRPTRTINRWALRGHFPSADRGPHGERLFDQRTAFAAGIAGTLTRLGIADEVVIRVVRSLARTDVGSHLAAGRRWLAITNRQLLWLADRDAITPADDRDAAACIVDVSRCWSYLEQSQPTGAPVDCRAEAP